MYVRMTFELEDGQTELTAFVTGFSKFKGQGSYVENIAHLSSDARIWLDEYSKYFSCFTLSGRRSERKGTIEYSLMVRSEDGCSTEEIDVSSVRFIECPQFSFGMPDE